jgi:hypothetical protein
MRFLAPPPEPGGKVPPGAIERAYVAGMEGIPWRSRNSWCSQTTAGGLAEFVVERDVNESGNLYLPWCVRGHGEYVLSTASLMERAKPYHLLVELARGTVNRVRNQVADWQCMGLQVTPELENEFKEMSAAFSQAATSPADQQSTSQLADEAIRRAFSALEKLTTTYASQAIASRRANSPTLPTFFAGRIETRPLSQSETDVFGSAFNSAMLGFRWRDIKPTADKWTWDEHDRQIQWCHDQGLRIIGGPLLQLDDHHVPDWLNHVTDFQSLFDSVSQYVRAVIERYRGQVHVWNCAARMNLAGTLALNEEQRLRLIVAVIDEVQRADPRTPYIISFDQPWAEYLSTADHDFSPLHFADSLVRAELGLAGIALEMNFGYWPHGTLPRDWLEVSRQLDRWNLLGLPLLLQSAIPSATSEDPQARVQVRSSPDSCIENTSSLATQQKAAERLALLALAKSFVHGFIWNEISDTAPHEFAHGGLIDAAGQRKPACETLINLRRQFLT